MLAIVLVIIWFAVSVIMGALLGLPVEWDMPWPPAWRFLLWFVLTAGLGWLFWYLHEYHYENVFSFLGATAFIIVFFGTGIQVFFGKGGGKRRR